MNNVRNGAIEAVIFDLGGVLIDFDFEIAISLAANSAGISSSEVRQRLFTAPVFEAFERGEISPPAFHAELQTMLGCQIPYADFCTAWNGIFTDEIEGNLKLLRELRARGVKIGILSNTNALHFEYLRERMQVLRELDHVYASHEIGARKPEPEAFRRVLARMSVAPEKALFIDDYDQNVMAAQSVGMKTILAINHLAVLKGCAEFGLISGNGSATPSSRGVCLE
ncbi:MAG TPA: HAD family phosphatase [Planctomycetota bacterium]|jgi:putative hydrolase of the HAD superfamily